MNWIHDPDALARLQTVRCFVLDMDGTFYLGDRLLSGSKEFLDAARASGRRVLFLTNNSSHDGEYYVQKLSSMGCSVRREDIYTSGMATCGLLNREYPGMRVHLLGNEYLRREFHHFGIPLDEEHAEVVVAGYDTTLDYDKLCRLCDAVRRGLPFVATHPDFNCPTETGFVPDIGAILAFVEASTGRRPDVIVGKPHDEIVRGLLEVTGLTREALCICGDRLYTDIATGVNHNILSICVLTGETTVQDLKTSAIQPHLVMDRLANIIPYAG